MEMINVKEVDDFQLNSTSLRVNLAWISSDYFESNNDSK